MGLNAEKGRQHQQDFPLQVTSVVGAVLLQGCNSKVERCDIRLRLKLSRIDEEVSASCYSVTGVTASRLGDSSVG